MGWRRVTFLLYILICVTLAVILAGWTLRLFNIESDRALVPLFIILVSLYGGLPVGLAYDRFKGALIDEKMRTLLARAKKFIDQGSLTKAETLLGKLRSLAAELNHLDAGEIKQLESKVDSLKQSQNTLPEHSRKWLSCEKCSGHKTTFLEGKPSKLFLTLVLLFGLVLAVQYIEDSLVRSITLLVGLGIAFLPALTLIRVRCLNCEPKWKTKMWGKATNT